MDSVSWGLITYPSSSTASAYNERVFLNLTWLQNGRKWDTTIPWKAKNFQGMSARSHFLKLNEFSRSLLYFESHDLIKTKNLDLSNECGIFFLAAHKEASFLPPCVAGRKCLFVANNHRKTGAVQPEVCNEGPLPEATLTKSDQIRPNPTKFTSNQNPTKSDRIWPNLTESDRIRPNPTKSDGRIRSE